MFVYEKRLQYPIKIKNTNPKLASLIISQYGGPDPNKRHPRKFNFRGCS
ncbi:MAG: manganese catalase family protein, partial [Oscillospiraceae bacterium]|nr:manganese catalase family protein [Oscillospiraceae bacterium]